MCVWLDAVHRDLVCKVAQLKTAAQSIRFGMNLAELLVPDWAKTRCRCRPVQKSKVASAKKPATQSLTTLKAPNPYPNNHLQPR